MEFNPPIESRASDQLIVLSKSTTDDYQAKAIELAKKELKKRKISQTEIDKRYTELLSDYEKAVEQTLTEMAAEDYSILEKILIVALWPKELLHSWHLKKEGYTTKAASRLKLIILGVVIYALVVFISEF